MYDIITLGSGTVDVFVNTECDIEDIKHKDYLCYPLGTKILIDKLNFTTGGGGTNTAVSFARLGMKTAYLGNLGDDENGDTVIRELKKENVRFIGTRDASRTNYSVILDAEGHDRVILAYKDASHNLSWRKIDKKRLKTKCFYSSSLMGKSFDTLKDVVRYAEKNDIKVAFNPSCYQVEKGRDLVLSILDRLDVLVFNKEEALTLLDQKSGKIDSLLTKLHGLGPKIVVITCGNDGAYAYDGEHRYFVKPPKVKIVETTGAGDAFASGFVAAYIRKGDIKEAMGIAQANASSIITHYGAKNELLTWNKAKKTVKDLDITVKKNKL